MGRRLRTPRCCAGWPRPSAAPWMKRPPRWPGWEPRARPVQDRRTSKAALGLEPLSPLLPLEAVFLVLALALRAWWNSYSSGVGAKLSPLLLLLKYLWTGRSCSREWSNSCCSELRNETPRSLSWPAVETFLSSSMVWALELFQRVVNPHMGHSAIAWNKISDLKNLLGNFRVPF